MMYKIPYGKQNITENDIQAVIKSLTSTHLTQGPKIKEFEEAFATYIGCKYAVAVANGTAALHLCAMALNVAEGQKVITTPITFAASANCIRYCGGDIVFADIDPKTYLLDIDKVEKLLEAAPKNTYSGIIPVDFAGRPVDLEKFKVLADKYNLWIIEDACHAPGGYIKDSFGKQQNCGNGQFAELAIFSFHPVKHIACGEGGMITTNDESLYKQLNRLRSHGITKGDDPYLNSIPWAAGDKSAETYPGWYMEMQQLGYNYRLTDIQSALGLSQLERADQGLTKRRQIAQKYDLAFNGMNGLLGQSGYAPNHAYHLYIIEVVDRLGLYNALKAQGIFAQIHYIPTHLMPYYRQFGWKEGDLPHAEKYYAHCISLPMYPTLTDDEQNYVIQKVKEYCHG
ncbi:MAG: UDP-4-amino-4,6-dideoxy-N-acetyl-beta-L-altrosamine transaminase [Saprospiraceae bacterium]